MTVAAYEIAGSQVVVPQRVDPERRPAREQAATATRPAALQARPVAGADEFLANIDRAPEDQRPIPHRLTEWSQVLEREGLATLTTVHGTSGRLTLLPRLPDDNVGLVTIWNDGGAYVSFWRSVFERRAPGCLPRLEAVAAPAKVGRGTTTRAITDELLTVLTDAYREVGEGRVYEQIRETNDRI